MNEINYYTLILALLAGAVRVGTPFLFVSLGECLTEKSGRINLGLEGTLIAGAMSGYAVSYLSGSAWIGVFAAGAVGILFGLIHGLACSLPKVNDTAFGIALILLGTGFAFFLGKDFIQPQAPMLPTFSLGEWSQDERLRSALNINALFFIGLIFTVIIHWGLKSTRWGLILRLVGDNVNSAQALGYRPNVVRIVTTSAGGCLAAIGGAYLSLCYPGSWNEGLSSGQGIMAVALVIFARWKPMNCLWASLLFGATGAIAPALQAVGINAGYYLLSAAPYALTLIVMLLTCRPNRSLAGAPGELSINR